MTAPEPSDALRTTLTGLSDTKLLLGYHYGEWTFGPPAIEAGIAACSMAQEEFGHARLLNGILKREYGLEIDPLADTRPPERFASIAFLDRPFASWPELIAANAVVDQALALVLSAYVGSSSEALARIAPKMLLEEKFHYAHAAGWVRLLEAEGGPPRAALHAAIGRAARDTAAFFGPPGADDEAVARGARLIRGAELRDRLFARLAELLEDPGAGGLVEADGGWGLDAPIAWEGWDPERRRLDGGGPDQAILDELRGTKNVAFKTA
ncbi:MAG: Phenylacetic acid catabolic protein [Gemmatimonadota bacterium]